MTDILGIRRLINFGKKLSGRSISFCLFQDEDFISFGDDSAGTYMIYKKVLPEYAQPVEINFIKEMPLTPIGKVDYKKLEELSEEKI